MATAPAPTITLATALDSELRPLSRLLRRDLDAELSFTALSTLARLADDGASRITELASAERVSQPTMTTLVQRLEADGLVERGADPDDARAVRVAASAEGRRRLGEVRARRERALGGLLDRLDASDREAIAAALPALARLTRIEPGS